jgi:diguanylate cyclase (GGDEF)-like protein
MEGARVSTTPPFEDAAGRNGQTATSAHRPPAQPGDSAAREALVLVARDFADRVRAETALAIVGDFAAGIELRFAWGFDEVPDAPALRKGTGFVGRLLDSERPAVEAVSRGDALAARRAGPRVRYAVGAPIRASSGCRGVLSAGLSREPAVPDQLLLRTASAYAGLAAACLERSEVVSDLMGAARRDGLTGCLNYAGLQRGLEQEIDRCRRHGRSLACCFLDVDGFKLINDRFGHPHGNRVLATVASALSAGVRSSDTVGRYGGDEFVVVLPETDEAAALALVPRLRTAIDAGTRDLPGGPVRVSAGVAQWALGYSGEDLIAAADRALWTAKASIYRVASASTVTGWTGDPGSSRPGSAKPPG